MQRALAEARATGRVGTGIRNRDTYLSQLEGVFVDDDPAQGVIDGATFTHPDLRIQFSVPRGYLMSNGTDAVTIAGPAGKAQFEGGPFAAAWTTRSCGRSGADSGNRNSRPAAAARHHQRHARGDHHGALQQPIGRNRRQRRRPTNGSRARIYHS